MFLKTLSDQNSYLNEYTADFSRRFACLLGYEFSKFAPGTALQILGWKEKTDPSFSLKNYFTAYDLERINLYAKGIVDYHLIIDLLPMLVKLVATGKIKVTGLRIGFSICFGMNHVRIARVPWPISSSSISFEFHSIIKKP